MKEFKKGQKFRSTTELVLLTFHKEERGLVTFQVADSEFFTEGPSENIEAFFRATNMEAITEEEFQMYLKTNQEDILKLNEQRKG